MSSVTFLAGLALVAVGAALIYLPAGLIVGGGLLALFAAAVERGNS